MPIVCVALWGIMLDFVKERELWRQKCEECDSKIEKE